MNSGIVAERFADARTVYNKNGKQSQTEVADNMTNAGYNIQKTLISDIENEYSGSKKDGRNVGYKEVAKLAQYYGVSSDFLLGLSPVPTTDTNLKAVCEFTGLSEKAVAKLQTIKSENKQTWCMDVLNSLIEAGDFDALLYFITQYSTKQNKDLQVKNYVISSNDIEETKAQNTLHDIMKDLKAHYQDKEDYRPAYQFLYSCHQNGKCSDEDFERIEKEFDRGDFSELQ